MLFLLNVKKFIGILIILCLIAGAFTGCGKEKAEAAGTLEPYLNHIRDGEYDKAYELLSDFDKGNITRDTFVKWRELVAQIIQIESFSIDSKVDTFKNYKYMGAELGMAYGLKVNRKQKALLPDIPLGTYDETDFRIMVSTKDGNSRVLLLLTNLDETVAAYEAHLEKQD